MSKDEDDDDMIALLLVMTLARTDAPTVKPTPAAESKPICRRVETTVSRIGSKRICRTKAEWDSLSPGSGDDARLRNAAVPR